MRLRRPVAVVAALVALTGTAAAGCGGSSATVTKTITTDRLPATTAPPSASAPTTPGVTAPPATVAVTVGEEQLPPPDALAGLRSGSPRVIDDPAAFVDALLQAGDPTKPAATARLTAGGYVTGVLRDQVGTNPTEQIALFRSYAIAMRDEAAATAEVAAQVQEVRDSTTAPTSDLALPDIPGAQGLHVEVDEGDLKGAVALVIFPAGRVVYGLQGISTDDADLPQDAIIGAARDLYERVTAAP